MIRVLPVALQNQIAAGEVVERPASVVKELLENSLDAGADRIRIVIDNGGRSRILIQDNGSGMAADELPLAVTRHATSKISTAQDLNRITSLGFRGEALPSIGAVGRLTINSVRPGDLAASSIRVEFGEIVEQGPTALAEGTHVEVRDLFSNLPARLKFLKTQATETRRCQEIVERVALAHLDRDISFTAGGREVHRFLANQSLRERLDLIWPEKITEPLIPVSHQQQDLSITGLAGAPQSAQARPDRMLFYVNLRPVRDPLLLKAVREAYRGRLLSRESPQVALFLELPPEEVDVNVHPAKTEVRFRDKSLVFSLVRTGVRRALDQALEPVGPQDVPPPPEHGEGRPFKFATFGAYLKEHGTAVAEPAPPRYEAEPPAPSPSGSGSRTTLGPSRADPVSGPFSAGLTYLGQLAHTYLICLRGSAELLLVDQHAAHERVLFAAYTQEKEEQESQLLALPLELVLHAAEQSLLQELSHTLRRLGFGFELSGSGLLQVRRIPAALSTGQAKSFLRDALSGQARDLDDLWTLMACRTAIKAGDRLTRDEALSLLEAWQAVPEPHHCPHGRPVTLRFAEKDLAKLFKRT